MLSHVLTFAAGAAAGTLYAALAYRMVRKPLPHSVQRLIDANGLLSARAINAEAALQRHTLTDLLMVANSKASAALVGTGPISRDSMFGANPEPFIRLVGAYECHTCGSGDRSRYVRCNHPGCPDGRDQ